jgi:hypothetical protein
MKRAHFAAAAATVATFATVSGIAAGPAAMAATTSPAPSSGTPSSGTPSSGTPSSGTADDTNGCPAGHLPAMIEGAPQSYYPGDARGAWIWHGKSGYALRVTHPQDGRVVAFTGSVTADAPIKVKGVQLEANDHYWFSTDHKTLYFSLSNRGYTDGVDFTASCASKLTFNVRADGALLSPDRVRLGVHAIAAPSAPFTVTRRK